MSESTNWYTKVSNALGSVGPLGSFAATGELKDVPSLHPKITVDDFGRLALPLLPDSAAKLKNVMSPAPFGKGTETVYDDEIRRAFQIDSAKVSFGERTIWDEYVQKVVEQASYKLGISQDPVEQLKIHATLYKMLLYDTGCHFKAHKDTEKEVGMFGTLVLQLPSEHTGKGLIVSHEGKTLEFDLSADSGESMHFIAFYADCEHELHPITSGYRLCLVYNLVADLSSNQDHGFVPSQSINDETVTTLRQLAEERRLSDKSDVPVAYTLDHQYTPQSFGYGALKGRDAFVAQVLQSVKADGENHNLFDVDLIMFERYIYHYGGEIGEDTFTIKSVVSKRKYNSYGFHCHSTRLAEFCNSSDEESASEDRNEDGFEIDNRHKVFVAAPVREAEPYYGNEGGNEKVFYRTAAIVFTPSEQASPSKKKARTEDEE